MNKLILFICSIFVAGLIFVGCSGKKESSTASSNTWAEMDAFHMIMAESFHPLKDSANLAPAKANAESMASEAAKWASASLPAKVDNEEVKAMLEGLKASTRTFADKVKGGATDEELATSLTALHDEFHALHEAWQGGGHEEHH